MNSSELSFRLSRSSSSIIVLNETNEQQSNEPTNTNQIDPLNTETNPYRANNLSEESLEFEIHQKNQIEIKHIEGKIPESKYTLQIAPANENPKTLTLDINSIKDILKHGLEAKGEEETFIKTFEELVGNIKYITKDKKSQEKLKKQLLNLFIKHIFSSNYILQLPLIFERTKNNCHILFPVWDTQNQKQHYVGLSKQIQGHTSSICVGLFKNTNNTYTIKQGEKTVRHKKKTIHIERGTFTNSGDLDYGQKEIIRVRNENRYKKISKKTVEFVEQGKTKHSAKFNKTCSNTTFSRVENITGNHNQKVKFINKRTDKYAHHIRVDEYKTVTIHHKLKTSKKRPENPKTIISGQELQTTITTRNGYGQFEGTLSTNLEPKKGTRKEKDHAQQYKTVSTGDFHSTYGTLKNGQKKGYKTGLILKKKAYKSVGKFDEYGDIKTGTRTEFKNSKHFDTRKKAETQFKNGNKQKTTQKLRFGRIATTTFNNNKKASKTIEGRFGVTQKSYNYKGEKTYTAFSSKVGKKHTHFENETNQDYSENSSDN